MDRDFLKKKKKIHAKKELKQSEFFLFLEKRLKTL